MPSLLPLALTLIRKARATAVASDFKTLSRAISSSKISVMEYHRRSTVLEEMFARLRRFALSDNEGVYDFVIFTNKEVDTSTTLHTAYKSLVTGFPA